MNELKRSIDTLEQIMNDLKEARRRERNLKIVLLILAVLGAFAVVAARS